MEMKRSRGFTFIEILTVSALALLVVFLLGETTSLATKSFSRVQSTGTNAAKGRYAFQTLNDDIKNSSACLSEYPVDAAAVFTAQDNSVLILKQPVFDTNDELEVNKFRIVIYKLENAATAEDGPKVLKKYVAAATNTTEGAPALEGVVAKNLAGAEWSCSVNQYFWGNAWQKEFWLLSTPQAANADVKNEILVGGVDRIADGRATLAGDKVTFDLAPGYAIIVDASFHGDETRNIDGTGNNGASSIFIRLKFRTTWQSAGETTKERDVTYSSKPTLMNKPE